MSIVLVSKIIQIFASLVLVGLILIQGKGAGLSSTFGNSFGYYRSRRGVEKLVFILTILFGVALVVNSLVLILLK